MRSASATPTATSANVAITPPCSTPCRLRNSGRTRQEIVTPSSWTSEASSSSKSLNGTTRTSCCARSSVNSTSRNGRPANLLQWTEYEDEANDANDQHGGSDCERGGKR